MREEAVSLRSVSSHETALTLSGGSLLPNELCSSAPASLLEVPGVPHKNPSQYNYQQRFLLGRPDGRRCVTHGNAGVCLPEEQNNRIKMPEMGEEGRELSASSLICQASSNSSLLGTSCVPGELI